MLSIISFLSVDNLFAFRVNSTKEEDIDDADENGAGSFINNRLHPLLSIADGSGDCVTLLNLYDLYQKNVLGVKADRKEVVTESAWMERYRIHGRAFQYAIQVRKQLVQHCINAGLMEQGKMTQVEQILVRDVDSILQCLLEGFFCQVAVLQQDKLSYKVLNHGHVVRIHPSSVLFYHRQKLPGMVMYHELVLTSKCYMRGVNRIEPKWLQSTIQKYRESMMATKAS